MVGIRSNTKVTEKVLDNAPDLLADRRVLHRHQPDRPRRRRPAGHRRVQRAVLQHPQRRRARHRRDHRARAAAPREDPADARRHLGQVRAGQPRGARPHARHRRLRQHRHPAVQPRRGPRLPGDLLRHRRPARARQRAPGRHPRPAPRRVRRGHAARRRTAGQRRAVRCRRVRQDEAALDVHQRLARHGRRRRRAARAHPLRPHRRRRARRVPGRAQGAGRPVRVRAARPAQRDPDPARRRLDPGGAGGDRLLRLRQAVELHQRRQYGALGEPARGRRAAARAAVPGSRCCTTTSRASSPR